MLSNKPYQLEGTPHARIWGSRLLDPWFPNPDEKVGEYWFVEPGSPILIKFIFTTEKLSVQVHPNDEQAKRLESTAHVGKTEMWHILRAEPGAQLAIGLKEPLPKDEVRAACLDKSIMDKLRWVPAVPGETWLIPAGTVHAIGAGIILAEVQQNSDVTYRLYDYGRPRELHLEKGMEVSDTSLAPEPSRDEVISPFFHTTVFSGVIDRPLTGLMIVAEGSGVVDGEVFRPGQVWRLPPGAVVKADGARVLVVISYS